MKGNIILSLCVSVFLLLSHCDANSQTPIPALDVIIGFISYFCLFLYCLHAYDKVVPSIKRLIKAN